ncbi:hypothetical protein ACIBL5_02250 [Streptomyces sp. NPDC050516]|uniref:hypothetical protein n=1 Tax=Streptomyces sp. NPDC050516 TaxID=3365621 RepID=UPI0037A9315A
MRTGRREKLTGYAAVLAALVTVAGCGGSGDAASDKPAPAQGGAKPAVGGKPFTQAQTDAALLTAREVGAGWAEDQDPADSPSEDVSGGDNSDVGAEGGTESANSAQCDTYMETWNGPKEGQDAVSSTRDYAKDSDTEHLTFRVVAYPSAEEAAKAVAASRALPAACDGGSLDFNWGGPEKSEVKSESVAKVGDEAVGMRVTAPLASVPGTELHLQVLTVREGANVSTVTFAAQTPADPALLPALLTKAAARLHTVAQGATPQP